MAASEIPSMKSIIPVARMVEGMGSTVSRETFSADPWAAGEDVVDEPVVRGAAEVEGKCAGGVGEVAVAAGEGAVFYD